jgi:hypothetical protein
VPRCHTVFTAGRLRLCFGVLEQGPIILTCNDFKWLTRLLIELARLQLMLRRGRTSLSSGVLKQRLTQDGVRTRRRV